MVKLRLNQQQIEDDRLAQYIQILHKACAQELTLINNLLDLQCLEAGRQLPEAESVNLDYWLLAIVEPFSTRVQEQQQQLDLDLPLSLPEMTTDLNSLKRIVTELLHNAYKHTLPHEKITISASVQNTHLCLQVSNSGINLSPEELLRLFDKFYRVAEVDR